MASASTTRRFLAGITAVAASAMLILAGGSAAHAAPTFDPDELGSITFHKYDQTDTPGPDADGTQIADGSIPAEWKAVAGVKFTATKVAGIDLTTNEGWKLASELSVTDAGAKLSPDAADKHVSGETTAAGLASVEDLPVGLYFVEETTTPAGYIPAAPFLVSIPMTHPTDLNRWMFDIHVYPKNSSVGTKSVEDEDAVKVGDEIVWTITGSVQMPASGESIKGYAIADRLDAKLTYVANPGAVASITGATGGGQLTAADYAITHFTATNTVVAVLNTQGLAKLDAAKKANPATQVQLTVPTIVNAVGEISNTGLIFPNEDFVNDNLGTDPANPTDPTDPCTTENCPIITPPAITKFGEITFTKVNAEGNALAGAEFKVYVVDPNTPGALPIEIDGKSVFTSDSKGLVTISGLRYSNWANGVAIADTHANFQPYWIVETKAPAGYEMLAEPVKVKVNETVEIMEGAATGDLVNIVNVKRNAGFELPLTGGAGTWALSLGGLLLVVGGSVLAIRRKKTAARA